MSHTWTGTPRVRLHDATLKRRLITAHFVVAATKWGEPEEAACVLRAKRPPASAAGAALLAQPKKESVQAEAGTL